MKNKISTPCKFKWFNKTAVNIYHTQLTTKLPMIIVSRKNGIQITPEQWMQFHMDSTHSPHRTLKTIMKECRKSLKFHLGISWNSARVYFSPNNCMPMTAKMKMMIASTKHRLPRAPMVLPMIPIRRLSVGQDFANLKTRSCECRNVRSALCNPFVILKKDRFF